MGGVKPVIHRYTTTGLKMVVNVFLIETEKSVVLVDAATALSSSREIRQYIDEKIKKPLKAILLTHGHPDHYIGAGEIVGQRGIPVISTQEVCDCAHFQDEYKIHTLKKGYGDNFPARRIFPDIFVKGGDTVAFDGTTFSVTDFGPAESDADCTWETTIAGVRHIFAGDLVYNRRHCYFRDGHARTWIKVLDTMLDMYDHRTIIHPGHGDDGGPEIIFWQKAYIEAFLYTLKSLLGDKETLAPAEQEVLYSHMTSFLPGREIIFLLQYEPDQTIKALREHGSL